MSEVPAEVTGGTAILNLGDGSQMLIHIPASSWQVLGGGAEGPFALIFHEAGKGPPRLTRLAEGGAQFRLAEPEGGIWRPAR